MASFGQIMLFSLIPISAIVIGGAFALYRTIGPQLESKINHFTAGVVFAAVAVDLIPEITDSAHNFPVVIGFALGVGAMLAMRSLLERLEGEGDEEEKERDPRSMLIAVAIDVFVDGFLVGISFAAGESQGVLISIALGIELIFLSLSTSTILLSAKIPRTKVIATTFLLAGIVAISAAIGGGIFAGLTGGPLVIVMAFACAALLYLVTEELLVEAHVVADSTWATGMFFLGFLLILMLRSGHAAG
ncbi:ZIP Zinc transporter [Planctomycetes bacterium Pan216]|uniref:ZIP Zinc transporter n=1 Tax=Kolteria novifilia TaxID=2527975 RepID=A0A518B654_9BACT|nr:ZIP Zinc transporter [Planctomycetes bacterium Pan216]